MKINTGDSGVDLTISQTGLLGDPHQYMEMLGYDTRRIGASVPDNGYGPESNAIVTTNPNNIIHSVSHAEGYSVGVMALSSWSCDMSKDFRNILESYERKAGYLASCIVSERGNHDTDEVKSLLAETFTDDTGDCLFNNIGATSVSAEVYNDSFGDVTGRHEVVLIAGTTAVNTKLFDAIDYRKMQEVYTNSVGTLVVELELESLLVTVGLKKKLAEYLANNLEYVAIDGAKYIKNSNVVNLLIKYISSLDKLLYKLTEFVNSIHERDVMYNKATLARSLSGFEFRLDGEFIKGNTILEHYPSETLREFTVDYNNIIMDEDELEGIRDEYNEVVYDETMFECVDGDPTYDLNTIMLEASELEVSVPVRKIVNSTINESTRVDNDLVLNLSGYYIKVNGVPETEVQLDEQNTRVNKGVKMFNNIQESETVKIDEAPEVAEVKPEVEEVKQVTEEVKPEVGYEGMLVKAIEGIVGSATGGFEERLADMISNTLEAKLASVVQEIDTTFENHGEAINSLKRELDDTRKDRDSMKEKMEAMEKRLSELESNVRELNVKAREIDGIEAALRIEAEIVRRRAERGEDASGRRISTKPKVVQEPVVEAQPHVVQGPVVASNQSAQVLGMCDAYSTLEVTTGKQGTCTKDLVEVGVTAICNMYGIPVPDLNTFVFDSVLVYTESMLPNTKELLVPAIKHLAKGSLASGNTLSALYRKIAEQI